jgi:hypothetical protein
VERALSFQAARRCRKRLFTIANFMDHLADDVLPGLINGLSTEK